MKTKLLVVLLLALALAGTSTSAWAARNVCTGGNDHATWSAVGTGITTVAFGGTGTLGVNMTSPTCLNTYPNFPGSLSVWADISLDASVCPDGSSGSTATCTLLAPIASITNNPQVYTDFGQTHTYTVGIDASNGATPGTYSYHVHANASDPDNTQANQALSGYGWGYGSGAEVTVVITNNQPACDPTQTLNVVFTQPDGGRVNFCTAGNTIPVSISAYDTSNIITALTASINGSNLPLSISNLNTTNVTGTASYAAGGVGAYKFQANAATACTSGKADVEIDLVYTISDLLPPLGNGARPKAGNAAPIKFIPTDCNSNPLPYDSSVHIKVYQGTTLLQDSYAGGCTGTSCGTGGSSNVQYDSTTGQYSTVFLTGNTAGITYTVQIWFGGVDNFDTTFKTK